MRASPPSRWAATSSTTAPVTPAGTISQTGRGGVNLPTRSATEVAPTAPERASASTAAVSWSYTTHSWPACTQRRTRFAPMRPSPIIPSCMSPPVGRDRRRVLAGGNRGADDSRQVPELGDDHFATGVDAIEEPVGVLDDSTADHDELGPQDVVELAEIAIEPAGPTLPREVERGARRVGHPRVRQVAVHEDVPELGVGHEHAVVEHGGADPGSDGDHNHHPAATPGGSEASFSEARGVRVVEHHTRPIGRT